jgi:hypothetical protein
VLIDTEMLCIHLIGIIVVVRVDMKPMMAAY